MHVKSPHKSSKFICPCLDASTKRIWAIRFLNWRTSHSLLRIFSRHSSAKAFRTTWPFTSSSTRIFPTSQPPPTRNDSLWPMIRNFIRDQRPHRVILRYKSFILVKCTSGERAPGYWLSNPFSKSKSLQFLKIHGRLNILVNNET